jgi:hypothetical protein
MQILAESSAEGVGAVVMSSEDVQDGGQLDQLSCE